jgi:hypothetical protein
MNLGTGLGCGQVVEREGDIVAVEIDLEDAVDRFANDGEFIESGLEQFLRHCHGNCTEHALRAKARRESCCCDRISSAPASARNVRRVDREMRWRWKLKVL